ncbi:A/G-specific adenine glycosylase [Segetibacter aerophilus]|uniref:Adenine DNA glycosylase n=2 Tax=Segetibacter aerophilus TaxID=670293 RepID=A0A512BIB4_9BACT|nr:A/G-specific adenine glycosylase [Segetibacter aerophilus]
MPWKGEKDPYKIWISEIILQQTRVTQGLAYYNNFIEVFPDLKSLAEAPNEAVFKAWEGLGYYSRCKHLLFTARYILDDLEGKFPETYENLLKLKGIGPYTAAAISSFAYGLPHAVVDGNVFRVLARFFGEAIAIDSVKGKELFTGLANRLLFKEDSAAYNQALMDFGATICKPQLPDCFNCVLQQECVAYNSGLVNELPVKEKRLIKRKRFFTYFIFMTDEGVLVRKRIDKDIWENLYEFYLVESSKELHWKQKDIKQWLNEQLGINDFSIIKISDPYTQHLTHQTLLGRFITVKLPIVPASLKHFLELNADELSLVPFPKFINRHLQDQSFLGGTIEKILV